MYYYIYYINKYQINIIKLQLSSFNLLNIFLKDKKMEVKINLLRKYNKITKYGRSKRKIFVRIKLHLTVNENFWLQKIPLERRKRFLKSYIRSKPLYGCEMWTIETEERRRPVSYTHLDVYKRQLLCQIKELIFNQIYQSQKLSLIHI